MKEFKKDLLKDRELKTVGKNIEALGFYDNGIPVGEGMSISGTKQKMEPADHSSTNIEVI